MARAIVRQAAARDLDILVRHRRGMWEAIAAFPKAELDAADRVYRRWARARMRSGRFAGFLVDLGGVAVASGCVWLMEVQPRPHRRGTTAAYLLSMFTEPGHRSAGYASQIVRASIRWAKSRGVRTMLLHASRFGEPVYARLGFERTTEMRLFLDGGKRRTPRQRERSSRRGHRGSAP